MYILKIEKRGTMILETLWTEIDSESYEVHEILINFQ